MTAEVIVNAPEARMGRAARYLNEGVRVESTTRDGQHTCFRLFLPERSDGPPDRCSARIGCSFAERPYRRMPSPRKGRTRTGLGTPAPMALRPSVSVPSASSWQDFSPSIRYCDTWRSLVL